jgi:hypothetical protein
MVVLKVVTFAIAGLLTLMAARHVMREMQAAKVKVRPSRPQQMKAQRLRQDPRTGIYYPES